MGDPITVGGGGGGLMAVETLATFDEDIFQDVTGGGAGPKHRTFSHKTILPAKSIVVDFDGKSVDFSQLLPADGDCKVEIKCPGVNDDVEIHGKPLEIRLHTGTYGPDPADPANKKKHLGHSAVNEIKIKVADQVIEIQPKGKFEIKLET